MPPETRNARSGDVGIPHEVPGLRRVDDGRADVAEARRIAGRLPCARPVELPGEDHLGRAGEVDGAGLHAGEVERAGRERRGIAVRPAARVAAAPGEVLVSQTVVDRVAGAGIACGDRGEREPKGIPGRRRLVAARP